MLRNGPILLLQHAISKSSRTCRLCCATNFDSKSYLHTSGDKSRQFTKASKGSGKGRINRQKFFKNLKPPQTQEEELFKPIIPEPLKDDGSVDIGEEIAGKLTKTDKFSVLKRWKQDPSIRMLASQHDMDAKLFNSAMDSFRKFLLNSDYLAPEIHVIFKNIIQDVGHVTDLFPFFLKHAQTVYPHLNCMEDLRQISDLTDPSQWYPLARSMQRKVIFHAGPTNSGKTYHALKRYMGSESGVYCGPLRLLAMEVFDKCNTADVPCDLITGETRMFANEDETPSPHVACTVEMMNINQEFDVAVIDEIQMISDLQRGWSWTRALLGVAAKEIHVCGEETAIDLVRNIVETTEDNFEIQRYERLTSLTYLDEAVGSFDNIRPGDCVVCFSKTDIFKVFDILTSKGHKCAVIYGTLPPGTKITQSRKFNDPDDPCNVMVATDAVGMGLNLAIKRVVFYSVMKHSLRTDFTLAIDPLSTSQAQQIGGRAGRFKTQYECGEVTTFWSKDLPVLKEIVNTEKNPLVKAGMNPTAEMIEMFSYHLPKASLSNLLDIFVHVCKLDDLYFMCYLADLKELAELIEHVPLALHMRFTLCSSPLKVRKGFPRVMFVKIARQLCLGMPLTYEWLCMALGAPFRIPKSLSELKKLEDSFDIVDLYLWLSYRYPDMFIDADEVRELRVKLDSIIQAFLLQGRVTKKRKLAPIFEDNQEDQSVEIDVSLIENSPLQAYIPKPKTKDNEKSKLYAEHANEMLGVANTVDRTEPTVKNAQSIDEVKSFWQDKPVVDIATDMNDLGRHNLKDSALSMNDDGNVVKPEPHSDKLDEERMKLYSKLTGSYNVKTMFQAEKVKNSMSEERKLELITAEITKRKVFKMDDVNVDDVATEKLGMKPDEVDNVKKLLTQMKIRKLNNPKDRKKEKDHEIASKFNMSNFVTVHNPKPAPQSVNTELTNKHSVENFKFAERFIERSEQNQTSEYISHDEHELSILSGSNNQTSENPEKHSSGLEDLDKPDQYTDHSIGDYEHVNDDTSVVHSMDADEETDSEKLTEKLLKRGILSKRQMQIIRAELENEFKQKVKKGKDDLSNVD